MPMNNNQVLIITDNRDSFFAAPLFLSPEKCRITGLSSTRYLGFTNIRAVVIDCAGISNVLKKVSLGICDNEEALALWQMLIDTRGPKLYMLVDKMQRPSDEMLQLGIEYIIASELKKLVESDDNLQVSKDSGIVERSKQLLTADDIRSLHQRGIRHLPSGARLTPWAAEVAESLNLKATEHKLYFILPVIATSKEHLASQHEHLFSLASSYTNLLFMVNELYLPVFNNLFPSLSGRTVAPSAHWASHGAFTGETSVQMLVDQRCFGAIIPAQKPYLEQENLKKQIQLAREHGLALFCTFTLASAGTCDIIATDSSDNETTIPLYHSEVVNPIDLPKTGAIVVNNEFLQAFALRKGN